MTEQTYETDTFNRYIPLSEAAAVFHPRPNKEETIVRVAIL